jgi:hypothetical protein
VSALGGRTPELGFPALARAGAAVVSTAAAQTKNDHFLHIVALLLNASIGDDLGSLLK